MSFFTQTVSYPVAALIIIGGVVLVVIIKLLHNESIYRYNRWSQAFKDDLARINREAREEAARTFRKGDQ